MYFVGWIPSNSGPLSVRHQVVTLHDLVVVDHPESLGSAYRNWYKFLLQRLIPNVDCVITVSNFSRDRIMDAYKVAPDRVRAIHNGVDARFVPADEAQIQQAVGKLGIPSRSYVLSVCSLEPRKNLRRLLMAWESIAGKIDPQTYLVLAGQQGARQVFADLDLGKIPERVHFAGRVPDEDLPALMSGASVFVYPSIYEGFGLPPLEAMACGAPSVASNTTAMAEVLAGAAALVDPLDPEAIGDAILRLVSSGELRNEMITKGRARASSFTWARAAQRTMAVLNEVAQG